MHDIELKYIVLLLPVEDVSISCVFLYVAVLVPLEGEGLPPKPPPIPWLAPKPVGGVPKGFDAPNADCDWPPKGDIDEVATPAPNAGCCDCPNIPPPPGEPPNVPPAPNAD